MFERRTRELKGKLSQADLAILSFVSQNPDAAIHMSVRELAAASFTGSTAVVRFYKKLGFESFGEMKLSMAKELEGDRGGTLDKDYPQISKATNAQAMRSIALIERQAIRDTENLLVEYDFDPVLNAMEAASGITVCGTGYSYAAGESFCSNMSRLGKRVTRNPDDSRMRTWASICPHDEMGVFVSYSGESPACECARIMARRGLKSVAITSNLESALAHACTWSIPVALTERPFHNNRVAPFSSTMESAFVLDALYAMYFRRHYTQNARLLTQSLERQGYELEQGGLRADQAWTQRR